MCARNGLPSTAGNDEGRGSATTGSRCNQKTRALIVVPRRSWTVPMAHRVARTPTPLKPAAVRCWAAATVAALGQEVTP